MATNKPRVTVTLDVELYEMLREMSRLSGDSLSRIVNDIIYTVAPTLMQVIEAGQRFEQLQGSVKDDVRRKLDEAEATIEPQLQQLQGDFMAFLEGIRAPADDAADPRPVTRGSRPPHPPLHPDDQETAS